MVNFTRVAIVISALAVSTSAIPVVKGGVPSANFVGSSVQATFDQSLSCPNGVCVNPSQSDSISSVNTPYSTSRSSPTDSKVVWSPQRLAIFLPTRYVYFFKMR